MNINKIKNSLFFKVICFMLIFTMLPWNTTTVKAIGLNGHDTYFIKTLLSNTGSYEVQVITDVQSFGDSAEENEYQKAGKDASGNPAYIDYFGKDFSTAMGASIEFTATSNKRDLSNTDDALMFSFPSYKRPSKENYNNDRDRATKVSSTLGASLNNLMSTVKSSINYKSLSNTEALSANEEISNSIAISRELKPTDSGGEWAVVQIGNLYIHYATGKNFSSYDGHALPDDENKAIQIDANGNLMAYITDSADEPEKTDSGFIWAMPKGYSMPGISNKDFIEDFNYWGVGNKNNPDTAKDGWLTIFSLAEYANAKAIYTNSTMVSENAKENNFIMESIYSILNNVYTGLLNLLKLNTISDLIYNQGTRGGSSYEAGMMNSSWWNTVLKYHLIFQVLAWMMLIAAMAKILLQINFSTVNPQVTISIMDTMQKIFTVGFSLALCIPFIRAMATLNNLIVGVFATQQQNEMDNISGMGIAGIIILFGYFGITFTMNCIYIMRAIMIAILTASAPLFITSMAFSGPKQKGLFDNWFKEITANIFMQAIHAFAFAFLFDVMDASNLLVKLVIYFSLLPIVDSFRQLIFGNAGGFAVAQGKAAAQTTGSFIKETAGGVAKGLGNAAVGVAAKKLNVPIKGTDDDKTGASGGGGGKSQEAGDRLSQNMATLGTALKDKGGKAAAAGTALRGLSKAGDFMKSTGGAMGNSVTQANLGNGNVEGSMRASKTYGEGIAQAEERAATDVGDKIHNVKAAKDTANYQKVNNAEQQMNDSRKRLNEKEDNYKSAKKILNDTKSDSSSSASDIVAAQQAFDESKSEFKTATSNYKANKKSYEDAASKIHKPNVQCARDEQGNMNATIAKSDLMINKDTGDAEMEMSKFKQLPKEVQSSLSDSYVINPNNGKVNFGKGVENTHTGSMQFRALNKQADAVHAKARQAADSNMQQANNQYLATIAQNARPLTSFQYTDVNENVINGQLH